MKITDKILDDYPKLGRNKNTWGFTFEINGGKTKFQIVKINKDYLVYVHQLHLQQDIWENTILLGVVVGTEDLESLFLSITRGEYL